MNIVNIRYQRHPAYCLFIGVVSYLILWLNHVAGQEGQSASRWQIDSNNIEWRFSSPPTWVQSLNITEAWNAVSNLSYTDTDKSQLIVPTLRLPSDVASSILIDYLKHYESINDKDGPAWGRAVYCLGLVQTHRAKMYLFDLWEKYDTILAARKSKYDVLELVREPPRLKIIGDALHYYLADLDTRKWFEERINESQTNKVGIDDGLEPDYIRRNARGMLIIYLYSWDIVDSVDSGSITNPENMLIGHYAELRTVTNLDLSAQRLVERMKQLPVFDLSINETEWDSRRQDPRIYRLDSTAIRLGHPFSLKLWNNYLINWGENEKSVEAQLWMDALAGFQLHLNSYDVGQWLPQGDDSAFLTSAAQFVDHLPKGYFKSLMGQSLWTISAHASVASENAGILEIRRVDESLLTINEKEIINQRIRHMRDLHKAQENVTLTPRDKIK